MKTTELTGAQLDYWTARAEGIPAEQLSIRQVQRCDATHCVRHWQPYKCAQTEALYYSANPAQGQPLIDKHRPVLVPLFGDRWQACSFHGDAQGDTVLEAVCRLVVLKAFGAEVEEVAVC